MAIRTTVTVYGLKRTDDPTIRYIGQTHQVLRERLKRHLFDARNPENRYHRVEWIRQALRDGVKIEIVPLVKNAIWDKTEMEVISEYRTKGIELTNSTKGGQGRASWESTKEFRQKRSKAMRGNSFRLGIPHTEEIRKQLSDSHKERFRNGAKPWNHGKELARSTKKKISSALKGRSFSEETIDKMKKPKSAAHCEAQRQAALKRWAGQRGEIHGS